jgi:hypothetical protein
VRTRGQHARTGIWLQDAPITSGSKQHKPHSSENDERQQHIDD